MSRLVEVPENAVREEPLAFGLTAPQLLVCGIAVAVGALIQALPLWLPLQILLMLLLAGPVLLAAILPIRGEPAYRWLIRAIRFVRGPRTWHVSAEEVPRKSEISAEAQDPVSADGGRLRRLWEWGYLERTTLPPAGPRGGAPHAYRLAPAAARRLGYQRSPWRGPGYLAHTLDSVGAVCALVAASDPETDPHVLLWLTESIAADVLPAGPLPDAVAVLASPAGALVLCLEIDEGNQHATPIRDKLRAYRRALDGRPGWHALFVVPTADRAAWLRRAARGLEPDAGSTWVTTLDELHQRGPEAWVAPVCATAAAPSTLAGLPAGPPRASNAPVGTLRWLEVLGSGGAESTT